MSHAAPTPAPAPGRPDTALVLPMPEDRGRRVALVLIRRMVGCGLRDASAALLALDTFGPSFQRPLTLARSLVVDLAGSSRRTIRLAPCCAPGMTRDEGLILAMIDGEGLAAHAALTDDAPCNRAWSTAAALGSALDDCCPV